jgi:hypothetical protein
MTIKYDLSDVTFLIPVRIESTYRKENLEILLNVLRRDFYTKFIVLEADIKPLYCKTKAEFKNVQTHFIYDEDPIFHQTHYRNELIKLATTPYVGIWDTDAIAHSQQIIEAIEILRQGKTVMSFPFDRRYYKMNEIIRRVFQKVLRFDLLINNISTMELMFGYQATGGAFIVDRKKYIKAGMENENFYGWGEEDNERVKRMEIQHLNVYYANGPLFHLWHPRGLNSWYPSIEIEYKNRLEFLKVCSTKTIN